MIIAGKEYGTGSSRDWAAKGPKLQGVGAVIAETFERIHRSNLIGMGILPLQFKNDMTRLSLKLTGNEFVSIVGLDKKMEPGADVSVIIQYADGAQKEVTLQSRIDTHNEITYYQNGGILQYVLRNMLKS